MTASQAHDRLASEMRVTFGVVPHSLGDEPLGPNRWQLDGDQFLLRTGGEHYFHYRRGAGVTIERGQGADLSEEALRLSGSVYSAVASIAGLLPIHASAVCHEGRVFAFTGPSGAGKSTLVAALAARGLALFADDTLVLDLSDPARVMCLPGHKRLKLTEEAIELTGARAEEPVGETIPKVYAQAAKRYSGPPLPLGELVFLEAGEEIVLEPITGAQRMIRLQDDHYTAAHFLAARRFDSAAHFDHLAELARRLRLARFARPWDKRQFAAGVARAADYIEGWNEPGPHSP